MKATGGIKSLRWSWGPWVHGKGSGTVRMTWVNGQYIRYECPRGIHETELCVATLSLLYHVPVSSPVISGASIASSILAYG